MNSLNVKIEEIQLRVIKNVEPKLQLILRNYPIEFKNDIEQDIRLKMYLSSNNINFDEIPSIFEVN